MKKIKVLFIAIAVLLVLAACGSKTTATAEFIDVVVDQTSISFNVEITDLDNEITGSTVVYLYNTDGNIRNQKTIETEDDLLDIYFYGLETETDFTVKVIATVDRDALEIGVYEFKTLTSEVIVINTVEEFNAMIDNRNGNFELGQDIDFTDVEYISVFNTSSLAFGGVFDGNGFALKNINFERISMYTGVFGYVSSGIIKDTTFENVTIGTLAEPLTTTTSTRVGIVAGYVTSQTAEFENIVIKDSTIAFSTSSTIQAYIGAVAGEFKGTMSGVEITNTNISVTSTSFGTMKIGGSVALIGADADISEVISDANIDFSIAGTNIRDDDSSTMIGGIVAQHVTGANISDVIYTGDINVSLDYNTLPDTDRGIYTLFVGGLIGKANDSISNAYFSGSIYVDHEKNENEADVRKQFRIGGLIGFYESNKPSNQIARLDGGEIVLTISDDVLLDASQIFGFNRFGVASDKGVNGTENLSINGVTQVPEVGINKIDDLEAYFTSQWILDSLTD
ncbi:LptM family lipoprotein [Mariniplasma anaerobium]|uniref:GLUG domain-containing protein n=1 Tax=Mariniplasma anaerobium TaxID=2735436 RepID=A0A7U9TLL9_9MOLU|nr:hypothetical protein [Mariniplasma anaerobium]BCR35391.1 hypothetical protein MPAN_002840 [Mariniplasma anaerobium]